MTPRSHPRSPVTTWFNRGHYNFRIVDHCNYITRSCAGFGIQRLIGRKSLNFHITNKLKRMMNAAARVLTGTRKFDRGLALTQLMHDNLHWLDVPERVKYKVIILTHLCLISTAPQYLAADCVPVSEMAQRRHLRSAAVH